MKLEDVVSSIPTLAVDAVCIATKDIADGPFGIAWVNDAFCRMYATSRADAMGCDPFALYHSDYQADFLFALQEMRQAGETSFSQDTLCLRCDGSSFWGGVSYVEIPGDDGSATQLILFVRDIDNLKNREQSAELALIENEHLLATIEAVQSRLMSAINMSPDPFCIFDARDRLVIWNPAFAENVTPNPDDLKIGLKKKAIIEMCLDNGFIDDAVGHEDDFLRDYMEGWRARGQEHAIMRIRGRDYKVIRSRSPNGDQLVLRVDVSEQLRQQRELETYAERLEQANREISEQALHDELTGLGNRRFLNTRLEQLKESRDRTGVEIAALHIDLDRFKQINDTLGHAAGDHVLTTVAEILRTRVRSKDVVARIGGDEFIVLMHCSQESDDPDQLAERLIGEICKPIPFEDTVCRLGASVGIARTPVIPPDDLLSCSDIALYKAKTGGRAMKAVFDHVDLENLRVRRGLADELLRALDNQEFLPHYQPQFDVPTDKVVALEVLARWQHPERGLLGPAEFLEAADENHILPRIDAMVFRKAVAEAAMFFGDSDDAPTLGFNVSRGRLTDPDLLDDVRAADYAGKVALELVESIFLEDEQANVLERIEALRALGVTFEVDDFGSGRASIIGLRRIEPDRLKIDHRLVAPIASSTSARRLVHSIFEIGRALNIGVTAEGIESAAHIAELKKLGCDRMQGYHLGRPASLHEVYDTIAQSISSNVA